MALPPAHRDVREGFDRVLALRALLSALGHLAGPRATGNVTATATSADVVLPRWTYGVPEIGGKAIYSRMVKTVAHTTVTSSGTSVAVRAVCGGASGNLPADTVILWQPCPVGLAARGVVPSGITGGVQTDGPGYCRRVVGFDQLGRDDLEKLYEATGADLPAIVIARLGSSAGDLGYDKTSRTHRFQAHVVTAHYGSNDERAIESMLLLDAIERRIQGRTSVDDEGGIDGEVYSGPGVETGREERLRSRPGVLVWGMEIAIQCALKGDDPRASDGVSWATWETTRLQLAVAATETQDAQTVVDVTAEET